jgi:hypothetical protein
VDKRLQGILFHDKQHIIVEYTITIIRTSQCWLDIHTYTHYITATCFISRNQTLTCHTKNTHGQTYVLRRRYTHACLQEGSPTKNSVLDLDDLGAVHGLRDLVWAEAAPAAAAVPTAAAAPPAVPAAPASAVTAAARVTSARVTSSAAPLLRLGLVLGLLRRLCSTTTISTYVLQ